MMSREKSSHSLSACRVSPRSASTLGGGGSCGPPPPPADGSRLAAHDTLGRCRDVFSSASVMLDEQETGGGAPDALKPPSMAPYSSASGATRPWPVCEAAMAAGGARNT